MKRLTTKQFIEKAREIHGDKYDYSKVEYQTAFIKVCIVCPKHGEFWQAPHDHFHCKGCPRCAKEKLSEIHKDSQDDFIKKAIEKHGDKYDYSKVNYTSSKIKVLIKCNKCGLEFWQKPTNHLSGQGCPICGKRLTKEQFIERARKIHGDKYDYSKSDYIDMATKVLINCNDCGNEFYQTPYKHIQSEHGCPICNGGIKHTQEQFINKAKEVHGNKYDYSKVNYINSKTKVIITCPKHGYFEQIPFNHLQGMGCPNCKNSIAEDEVFNLLRK